jgi:integrase
MLRGNTWWIQFCEDGVVHRESSHSDVKDEAERLLRKRLIAIEEGRYRRAEPLRVEQMAQKMFLKKSNGELPHARSLASDKKRWANNVGPFFGKLRAQRVSEDIISKYIAKRRDEGAANGTINREMTLLRRAFTISRIPRPPIPRLSEKAGIRRNFLTDEQYFKLSAGLEKEELWMRTLVELAATYGLRRGELLNLRVEQVDKATDRVKLEADQTKGETARVFGLNPITKPLVFAMMEGKAPSDYLLTREDGRRVKDFRKRWAKVCKRAGIPRFLLHDFRRTAVRNMVRTGIPRNVAKAISGHKTDAIFDRYDITDNERDIDAAAQKMFERRRRAFESFDTKTDTTDEK